MAQRIKLKLSKLCNSSLLDVVYGKKSIILI